MKTAKRDPWTDPDPQPGDFDEYLENVDPSLIEHVPAGMTKVIHIGDMDPNEWIRKRAAARARGERLPEEIVADEELARFRQALEQKQD